MLAGHLLHTNTPRPKPTRLASCFYSSPRTDTAHADAPCPIPTHQNCCRDTLSVSSYQVGGAQVAAAPFSRPSLSCCSPPAPAASCPSPPAPPHHLHVLPLLSFPSLSCPTHSCPSPPPPHTICLSFPAPTPLFLQFEPTSGTKRPTNSPPRRGRHDAPD
eukprot:350929-Chlamydomonas_euryale.AAC.4